MSPSPEEVVLGFLQDVRSGERTDRVHDHLARRVVAHQGRPGAERAAVVRDPDQHGRHVREMLASVGLGATASRTAASSSTGSKFHHDVANPGGALR
jgi:hypothetical protein